MKTSDKKSVQLLVDLFVKNGLRHIIISPGSRNAPVIISFAGHPDVEAIRIVDERSAAFFALGVARQTGKTVALSCTSGTAVLNYAPAIAEAYYQKVPLLILTADRPPELIDQGDGQTIRQKNIYSNYIRKSFELKENYTDEAGLEKAIELIHDAIHATMLPGKGPVHINIPFTEPLYNLEEPTPFNIEIRKPGLLESLPPDLDIKTLTRQWNRSEKKLLIAGMMQPESELIEVMNQLTNDPSVVLLSETTSNLPCENCFPCIDKVVSTFSPDEKVGFKPDILVTFGGPVISKMIKSFLRENKPEAHWNIDPVDYNMNTYQCLTNGLNATPARFFQALSAGIVETAGSYNDLWKTRDERSELRHREFLSTTPHSDLKVFEAILQGLPENSNLHLGNSTPVRYAQLFRPFRNLHYHSNRGTSGIDGTVSTGAGSAWATDTLTTVITGDLGFLYDSNALMNHHLPANLRIIIVNNGGGGIFRILPGPDKTTQLEKFFETRHQWNARYIARNFGVPYYYACNETELKTALDDFFKPQPDKKPAILEIMTPNRKNADVLRSYFQFLKD